MLFFSSCSRQVIIALYAIIIPLGANAHDFVNPKDPSIILERIIIEGLTSTAQTNNSTPAATRDIIAARSIFNRSATWTSKSQLIVCFWNGTDKEQRTVAQSAVRWNSASRISFSTQKSDGSFRKCALGDDSNIRISLRSNDTTIIYEDGQSPGGNWSLIGRQGELIPPGRPGAKRYEVTMNLPFIGKYIETGDLAELNFIVGHEFGHALGLLHEFQSSVCKDKIYINQLAKDQGWSGPAAKQNLEPLLDLPKALMIDYGTHGGYDIESLMQYNFNVKYYKIEDGKTNPCMRTKDVVAPSKGDIETVAFIYGKPLAIATPNTPILSLANGEVIKKQLEQHLELSKSANKRSTEDIANVIKQIDILNKFGKGILLK